MSRKRKQLNKRERATAEFRAREGRLKRSRTVIGLAGIIPLVGSLVCDLGVAVMCVPFSWYMWMWAAIFGAFIGLSIRLVRERRRFEEQSRAG
jgi:hypothetical protein